MAYDLVAETTEIGSSNTSTFTVTFDTAPTEGNLLIAYIQTEYSGDISGPSGWTQLFQNTNSAFIRSGIWYRTAGASEPASYNWTGPNKTWIGEILEYPPGSINAFGYDYGYYPNDGQPVSPTITPTVDGCLIIGFCGMEYDTSAVAGDLTISTSLTGIYDDTTTGRGYSGHQIVAGYEQQVTAAATGTYTHSISDGAHGNHSATIAILPAAASPTGITISFTGSTLLYDTSDVEIGSVTPVTDVIATIYAGHITSLDTALDILTGQTIDTGVMTLTSIPAAQTLSSTDNVTVEIYSATLGTHMVHWLTVD